MQVRLKRGRQRSSLVKGSIKNVKKRANMNRVASHPSYAHRISFYHVPPVEDITLEEFESFAIDRLKVLKEIDNLKVRGAKSDAMENRMRNVLAKYLPLPGVSTVGDVEASIRKDVISHFTLRLAYCKPNDRQWFLSQERMLLKIRLSIYSDSLDTFISENELAFPHITVDEFAEYEDELNQFTLSLGYQERATAGDYYKVPFEEALELVMRRNVLLKNGHAFVHRKALISLVLSDYRKHLSAQLARAYKQIPVFSQDFRIDSLIKSLPTQYLGRAYEGADRQVGEISLEQIDPLSKESFPLCMEQLHSSLRRDHHLKHGGRMQYGLFVKGLGLTLDQSLDFWREEFTRGGYNFEKDYSYNIRHNYGMVGKRTSYTPYACEKILNMIPGPGEYHGCAYKTLDKTALQKQLTSKGLGKSEISVVVKLAEDTHYQEACRQVFEYMHIGAPEFSQTHPNKYFDQSRKYFEMRAAYEKGGGPAETDDSNLPPTTVVKLNPTGS